MVPVQYVVVCLQSKDLITVAKQHSRCPELKETIATIQAPLIKRSFVYNIFLIHFNCTHNNSLLYMAH